VRPANTCTLAGYCSCGTAVVDRRQEAVARACSVLKEIEQEAGDYGVIGIDEGQFVSDFPFFSHAQFPDLVPFCEAMANIGKTVIVAALDGTFQRKVQLLCAILIEAVWSCAGTRSAGGECREAQRRVHGVLQRCACLLHTHRRCRIFEAHWNRDGS
jgi:hypothetical protein